MRVDLEVPNTQPSDQKPAANPRAAQNISATVKSQGQESGGEAPLINPAASAEQPNVTFRRDTNGRIYYVVSDAQSGDEIEELPPEEVRNVAAGIEDYSKDQAKARPTLNTKG